VNNEASSPCPTSLAADVNSPEQIAALENLNPNVFVVPNPTSLKGCMPTRSRSARSPGTRSGRHARHGLRAAF
jgi:hypothetical protein